MTDTTTNVDDVIVVGNRRPARTSAPFGGGSGVGGGKGWVPSSSGRSMKNRRTMARMTRAALLSGGRKRTLMRLPQRLSPCLRRWRRCRAKTV